MSHLYKPTSAASLVLALALFAVAKTQAESPPAAKLAPIPEVRALARKLLVLDENIVYKCHEEARQQLVCRVESELLIHNPTDQTVSLSLEVDERASRLELCTNREDRRQHDPSLSRCSESVVETSADRSTPDREMVSEVLNLSKPEGRLVKLAKAEIPPGESRLLLVIPEAHRSPQVDIFTPLIVTRHPLLGQYRSLSETEFSIHSVKKYRRWGEVKRTNVILRYPEQWRWNPAHGFPNPPPDCTSPGLPVNGLEGCLRTRPDGDKEASWTFSDEDRRSFFVRSIPLTSPRTELIVNGGPLLGIAMAGGTQCWDCPEALRMWAGYEIGITDRFLVKALAEYSPSDRLSLIPSLDVAIIPQLGAIPGISTGVGVPVRLVPKADLGVRFQVDGAWAVASSFSVGVVLLIDIYFLPNVEDNRVPLFGGGVQFGL